MDDRAQVQLLGGDQREAARQVEAHLVAKQRTGTDAGTVVALDTMFEYGAHQVEIRLFQRRESVGCHGIIEAGKWAPILHSPGWKLEAA